MQVNEIHYIPNQIIRYYM